jgi:transaldolase
MKIFLDTSDINEITKWLYLIDGITTNPTILKRDGGDIKEICQLASPRPVSVEVTTDDLEEMNSQAHKLSEIAENIVVKIPQENQFGRPCYDVMYLLYDEGIKVNATVAMSFGQVMASAKVNANYISIFAGRIDDEGGYSEKVIQDSEAWLRLWNYQSKVIVGSIRSVGDVLRAARAGADIITIPPEFMSKMVDHKYTRETVRQFMVDAKENHV